jgi:epoxyqueuosine reductase
MQKETEQIKTKAYELGFLEIGICDAEPLDKGRKLLENWLSMRYEGSMNWIKRTQKERPNPRSYFPEAKSVIVVAHNYFRSNEPIHKPSHEGNISIYARGRDYHKVLRKKLEQLRNFIYELLPDVKSRICVDSFPIMEKPLAAKAGIGWIGKHTNLIIKGKGSYFFLGEILLSKELQFDDPLTTDYCGTCNKCQVACPTNALDQPYVLDSNKCISYLTIEHDNEIDPELQPKMGNWIFGCDICQEVCPWNRFSKDADEDDYSNRFSEELLNLNNLKKLAKDEFDEIFNGTPVKRTGYDNFKRNVEIALKNKNSC